jgi:hypothetical protein
VGEEVDFTDFTYKDTSGKLTELLTTHGFIHYVENWSESPPIYHLEVKSTPEPCNEPFYMSNKQVEMVLISEVLGNGTVKTLIHSRHVNTPFPGTATESPLTSMLYYASITSRKKLHQVLRHM